MVNSLFDKGTMKKFDALAKKQAKLEDKKKNLVKKSMETMNPETLVDVLKIVKKYGHPREKKRSEEIEKKYFSGEELGFNDLMNLDSLYKSNFEKFSKKDDDDE